MERVTTSIPRLANALEHAVANRIVVYVETDDDGHVFASVDDDGMGFDPATPRTTHGIDESMLALHHHLPDRSFLGLGRRRITGRRGSLDGVR